MMEHIDDILWDVTYYYSFFLPCDSQCIAIIPYLPYTP